MSGELPLGTNQDTQFGFVYGPVQVVRMFSTEQGVMIGLADADALPHDTHTEIWVSAKGRSVRVNGKRLRRARR